MSNEQLRGPWHQSELDAEKLLWVHRDPPSSLYLRKKILAKVIEIGVQELFSTFAYTFGGSIFHQKSGAPIGTRVACASANLLMEWVWRQLSTICRRSGSECEIYLAENFVDDARAWVSSLRKGTRFDGTRFTWSKEAEVEDQSTTSEEITFR